MSSELQRIHDKINYETNVVDPKTFAILLNAVKENQPLSYQNGRDNIFPQTRSRAGMQWNKEKPDTHASNTLEQYALVNSTEDRTITVSDLGYKFMECFDSDYNVIVPDDYYKTILLKMIFSWTELKHGRNIHPGRMLFKLMLDSDLEYYLTSNEFALWTSDSNSMTDRDYEKIKNLILNYRENPYNVPQKKAEVFLRPFANSWGLFDREINRDIYTFTIKKEIEPLVKQFFICQKTENETNIEKSQIDENERKSNGTNILLYGVPGSGKSWTIEHEYCRPSTNVERLIFHPDYTYSDFIGQILPNVTKDGQVSYRFTPGPFTTILRNAYLNPDKEYILIIEEINRGNAPAIFGEVFQLLDRKSENTQSDDGFPIGTSEYGISNENIANIVYGDAKHKIRIPSNLSIIGTMNTSDQNVFTLDTAFQRRWEMRLIENNFEHVEKKLADAEILDTGITWKTFCSEINKIIVGNNARMTSTEDKRLGAYFVHLQDLVFDEKMGNLSEGEYHELCEKEENNNITEEGRNRLVEIRNAMKQNRKFPEKVIKYLWDDAFKFNREIVFDIIEYQNLEQVIRKFMYSEGIERFAMFKDNVRNAFTISEE